MEENLVHEIIYTSLKNNLTIMATLEYNGCQAGYPMKRVALGYMVTSGGRYRPDDKMPKKH